tara:strand:+ start:4626 stop:5702 length:1077 start_codon:yes stop_codon:yes gene_type:complete
MHPEFPSWYSHVDLENNSDKRQARWNAIETYLEDEDGVDVEMLLKLAHTFRQKPNQDQLTAFRQYFRDHDETFPSSGNEKELQLLAGSCLAVLANDDDYRKSPEAALAIITADFSGAREIELPINLIEIANESIISQGIKDRRRSNFSKSTVSLNTISLKTIAESVVNNWTQVSQAFSSTESIINENLLPQIQKKINADIGNAKKLIEIQDEELQMLWWVVGEYSHSADCPFDKLEPNSKALILAAELSDATKLIPGPAAIKALLSRAGLIKQKKKIKLTSAINSAPEAWLSSQLEGKKISPLTTPIHFAIERQLETGAGDSWVAGWSASTSIDKEFSLATLDLGMLYYRESLLASLE